MIVDDHKDVREVLSRRVQEAGHILVGCATNGPEALLAGVDQDPDVVVLDYMMPGMTGEEVAREMRERLTDVKIVACSGVAKSKPYWADAYVDKNQLEELGEVIDSV